MARVCTTSGVNWAGSYDCTLCLQPDMPTWKTSHQRVAANRKIFQMPNVRNLSDIENLLLKPTIHAARPLVLRYVAIK